MLLAGTQTGFQPVLRVCRAAIATVTVPTNLCIKENKLCAVIDYGSASKVLKKDPRNWPESGAKEREERRGRRERGEERGRDLSSGESFP